MARPVCKFLGVKSLSSGVSLVATRDSALLFGRITATASISDGIAIATDIVNTLRPLIPQYYADGAVSFNIVVQRSGQHYAHGIIYGSALYSVVNFMSPWGESYRIREENGNFHSF